MDNANLVVDSGIFIEYIRLKNKSKSALSTLPLGSTLFISSITHYELLMGATDSSKLKDVRNLTEDLIILPFTKEIAEKASDIFHQLKKKNKLIEYRDIFIASTAIVHKMPLKTLNLNHFERIDDLELL